MKQRSIVFVMALCAGLGGGVLAQQPAAPATAAPGVPHEDLSGVWNRLDLAGSVGFHEIENALPRAQLKPEFAARVVERPEPFIGFGTPPPGWVPPPYDITAQGADIPRCAAVGVAGGGGGGRGGGGSGPIMPNSSGISIMASNDVALFIQDGAQGATRRVLLDGRKFQDPSRVPGVQSYGYWDNGVLTIKSKGFGSGMVSYGHGWTEPTTELTETLKLTDGGTKMVWSYTYDDPNVYLKPHTASITYGRLPTDQYVFENFCDTKLWMADQAKQAAAGRAVGAGPAAGRGAAPTPAAPPAGR
jgi:hypothetical protein